MQYRRRLRSRIILSFLLLGFGLTAMFAISSLYLRTKLEGQLIDSTMQKEVDSLVMQARNNPSEPPSFSLYDAKTWSARSAYKMPLFLHGLGTGVHNISQLDENGKLRDYKYAIRRDEDLVSYVRYDVSGASLGERQLFIVLGAAVFIFTGLAWVIGVWSSSRVISPVTELAKRVGKLSGADKVEKLAPHFANDEVGELAATLDDYSGRMTQLVKRDREFNADVSHELRTPLAVIRGATELLLANPDLPEKARLRLQRIDRAALQCTDLTTALLMLSRNERGTGNTDIHKLANQLADANRAQQNSKLVHIHVEGSTDVLVNAPEAVLSVALGNLIGNACKYTQEGEVSIIVEHDRVLVQDTGPGLSEEDAARLFERGYRGSGIGATTGGGIGLSIVRRLCDLYEWKVSIKPREERGAEACLVFDITK
jgi:signal transduction histidine kinase